VPRLVFILQRKVRVNDFFATAETRKFLILIPGFRKAIAIQDLFSSYLTGNRSSHEVETTLSLYRDSVQGRLNLI
jgi:hypothetical protein